NQVLPGSIGGDLAKMGVLRTAEAVISIVLERLLGLVALLVLAAGIALFGVRVDPRVGIVAALCMVLIALLLAMRTRSFERPLLQRAAVALRALPVRALGVPFLVAIAVQLGNVAVYLLLARALRLSPGAGASFV